jgi:hypothetical protein
LLRPHGDCGGRQRAARGASSKKQRHSYSGKKKYHTQKGQIVIDHSKQKILCVATSAGKTHDPAKPMILRCSKAVVWLLRRTSNF